MKLEEKRENKMILRGGMSRKREEAGGEFGTTNETVWTTVYSIEDKCDLSMGEYISTTHQTIVK